HHTRNEYDLARGTFRVRGDSIEVLPAYEEDLAYRLEFFGDDLEAITQIDPLTGRSQGRLEHITIYPGSHHVTPQEKRLVALDLIKEELKERIALFEKENKLV